MKRRITTTIIALSLLLGVALWSAEPGKPAAAAMQANYPLNPNNFASLGASPFTSAGTYTIDASRNNANPILTKPDNTTLSGVFFTSSGGEIAVFTFDSLDIPAGVTVNGVRNANSRPIALLSKSSVTVAGIVDVSGAGGEGRRGVNDAGYGGAAGPGGGGGGGGGGGVGIPVGMHVGVGGLGGAGLAPGANGGNPVDRTPGTGGDGGAVSAGGGGQGGFNLNNENGGGGAFGGDGGGSGQTGSKGVAYGDLTMKLQGGSGGGGGRGIDFSSGGGGGGGGAIEIGAVNVITITGQVEANGGNGGNSFVDGGAGAGGGILVHANQVTLACSARLNANGGEGLSGGGGGGGRVHLAASAIQSAATLSTIASVKGGFVGFPQGQDGVVTTNVTPTVGPVAAKLAFSQQPTGTTPNTALSPAVTVEVQDACGTRITGSTATVTLALGTNPSGATLGGTTSVAAVDGIATFNNLTVNKPGTGYTLLATSGSLTSATSNAFDIACQTITINPTSATLSSGTTGANYSQTFTQTGGSGAITFIKTAGALPPGLTLSSAGVLGGTPNTAGTFTFTITAMDASNCPGNREYSLTIACPTVTASVSGSTTICPGGSATVTVNLSGGTAPWTVRLSNGAMQQGSSSIFNFSVNPAATTTYTASATDVYGCPATASGSATITVGDSTAPVITLNGANPLTVECANGFTDPGAMALDNCTGTRPVTSTNNLNLNVPGSYTITYAANDGNGNSATKTRTVNVVDTKAPLLTLKANLTLWPPNGFYHTISMSQMVQSVVDGCNTSLNLNNVVIEKVTSDEPDNAPGGSDGNTTNDIVIAANCQSVQLRSERDETKNGRVYVITLRVKDAAGNTTRKDFKVSVPMGQNGVAAVQGATAQTKTSSCP